MGRKRFSDEELMSICRKLVDVPCGLPHWNKTLEWLMDIKTPFALYTSDGDDCEWLLLFDKLEGFRGTNSEDSEGSVHFELSGPHQCWMYSPHWGGWRNTGNYDGSGVQFNPEGSAFWSDALVQLLNRVIF